MGVFDYVPNAEVQTDSAVEGIKLLVSIFPAIPFVLGAALLFLYEINKAMEVQIEADLNKRRINP